MTFYTFDPAITLRAAMARHVDCDTLEGAKCEVSNGKDLCMVVPDLDTMLGSIKEVFPEINRMLITLAEHVQPLVNAEPHCS